MMETIQLTSLAGLLFAIVGSIGIAALMYKNRFRSWMAYLVLAISLVFGFVFFSSDVADSIPTISSQYCQQSGCIPRFLCWPRHHFSSNANIW